MGVWTLEDTNSTVSQSLVLVPPKACILLILLLLINYHYAIFLNVTTLLIGLTERIV